MTRTQAVFCGRASRDVIAHHTGDVWRLATLPGHPAASVMKHTPRGRSWSHAFYFLLATPIVWWGG